MRPQSQQRGATSAEVAPPFADRVVPAPRWRSLELASVLMGVDADRARRTERRFRPTLQYGRFWLQTENRRVRLRLSNTALRRARARCLSKPGAQAIDIALLRD
jgi:ribosomal protein L28